MDKKDKIRAKIGKLLTAYGVTDEEKENFLTDLDNTEDEEEVVDEPNGNDEIPNEEPVDSEPPVPNEEPVAESDEEPEPEAMGEENEVPPTDEVPQEQPPMEEPQPPVNEPTDEQVDYKAKYEEVQKALDGMSARFDSLEEALRKVGVLEAPAQENPVGVPSQEPASGGNFEESQDDILKLLNR